MAKPSKQMVDRVRGHMFSCRTMWLTTATLEEDLEISYSSANGALNALIDEELIEVVEVEGQRANEYRWVGTEEDGLDGIKTRMNDLVDEIYALGRDSAAQMVSEELETALKTKISFKPSKNTRAQA